MNYTLVQSLDVVELADIVVTAIVGLVGLYLVHSFRRQQALRVAEKRLAAYQALWGRMQAASPFRLARWKAQSLTQEAREELFEAFTT